MKPRSKAPLFAQAQNISDDFLYLVFQQIRIRHARRVIHAAPCRDDEMLKTSALISDRCAIESNEGAGEVKTGAARWSIATWWQFEQATVAKSCPLRAVSAQFTI